MRDADLAQRAALVVMAFAWIGTPYRHQMSVKGGGTDCLGLIRGLWRELYGAEPAPLPPYTADWAERDAAEPLLTAARRWFDPVDRQTPLAGDLLLFRMVRRGPVKHCGLYVGERRFVHAYGGQAVTCSWYSEFWQQRHAHSFSFPLTHEDRP